MLSKFLTDMLPISENAANNILLALLVLGALFLVLSVIWLIVSLYEKMRGGTSESGGEENSSVPTVTVTDDTAVIAAISAAIAVILQEEAAARGTTYNGFRIVSFKRADKGRAWTQKNK